jgi:hypothetical protein
MKDTQSREPSRIELGDFRTRGYGPEQQAGPPYRRTWLTETRLPGWACEIRTQKCRRKISL